MTGRRFLLGLLFAAAPLSAAPSRLAPRESGTAASAPPPAQPRYKASLRQETVAAARLRNPAPGTFQENVALRVYRTQASLTLSPIVLRKTRGFLSPTLEYEFLHGDYDGWDSAAQPTQLAHFHAVGLGLFGMQPLSPVWRLTVLGKVALASEMRRVTREDLTVQGGFLVGRPLGKWTLAAGVLYANTFGTPLWLPGALIKYEAAGEKARFEAQVPRGAACWRLFGPRLEVGLTANLEGNQYHIDQRGAYRDKSLEYSTGSWGPAARWKTARATFQLETGTTFYRRFRVRDGDETVRSFKFKNAPFVQLGAEINFP